MSILSAIKSLYVPCSMILAGVMMPDLPATCQTISSKTTTKHSFQVDFPYPTTDKPQSKIGYMDHQWWALLPRASGPSLWQRTANGWLEHKEVAKALNGIPGRADAWFDQKTITAVGVSMHSLTVFQLQSESPSKGQWNSRVLAQLHPPLASDSIETATIAQDKLKNWWVAADAGNSIYVWHSKTGKEWSKPLRLAQGISKDDICSITALSGSVLVVWSDQKSDGVYCREHLNNAPVDKWLSTQTIQKGGLTADDHINITSTPDGTIWVATKNSLDSIGQPQLVLRSRNAAGSWKNQPYALRMTSDEPSRPVVVVSPDGALLSGNTVYSKKNRTSDHMDFGIVDATSSVVIKDVVTIIAPDASLGAKVNDLTVSKQPLPADDAWIVLASDKEGRVYEADLRHFFSSKTGSPSSRK